MSKTQKVGKSKNERKVVQSQQVPALSILPSTGPLFPLSELDIPPAKSSMAGLLDSESEESDDSTHKTKSADLGTFKVHSFTRGNHRSTHLYQSCTVITTDDIMVADVLFASYNWQKRRIGVFPPAFMVAEFLFVSYNWQKGRKGVFAPLW